MAPPTDGEFSPDQGFKELLIVGVEEVVSLVGPTVCLDRCRELAQGLDPNGGIVERRQEREVPLVGCLHQVMEGRCQTIDGLFQRGHLEGLGPIPLFYRPVVLKKGDIRDRHLNAEDEPEFVIEFQAHRAHVVFEPGAFEAGGEGGPECLVIPPRQLAAQEGGHILGFDGMDGSPAQDLIEIRERVPTGKENVRGILHLHETPVILHAESPEDWTILGGKLVQGPMEQGHLPGISELLGAGKIGEHGEGIIRELVGDPLGL